MARPRQTPEHKRAKSAWRIMRRRCFDKGLKQFPRYGGAGITVCPQWVDSFERFLADVGLPPTPAHWLGRRDTAGHYVLENVLWTTRQPRMNRRQFCQFVQVKGQHMTAAEAGRLAGMPSRNSVLRRASAGLSLDTTGLAKLYRRSPWITHQGETLPLPEWARRIGIGNATLWARLRSGMPVERALTPGLFRNPKQPQKANP